MITFYIKSYRMDTIQFYRKKIEIPSIPLLRYHNLKITSNDLNQWGIRVTYSSSP